MIVSSIRWFHLEYQTEQLTNKIIKPFWVSSESINWVIERWATPILMNFETINKLSYFRTPAIEKIDISKYDNETEKLEMIFRLKHKWYISSISYKAELLNDKLSGLLK